MLDKTDPCSYSLIKQNQGGHSVVYENPCMIKAKVNATEGEVTNKV